MLRNLNKLIRPKTANVSFSKTIFWFPVNYIRTCEPIRLVHNYWNTKCVGNINFNIHNRPKGNLFDCCYYNSALTLNQVRVVSLCNQTCNNQILHNVTSSSYNNILKYQKRNKSKKTQKRPEYDSDSEEEEDDAMSQVSKPITLRIQTLRLDGVLKKALNVARNKVETAFYEGNIRVNGKKPNKKSVQLQIGDEVDLIRGISPMNPDFLSISRVEVINVKEDPDEEGDTLIVKIRRTKTMYIENYDSNPWKKSTGAE